MKTIKKLLDYLLAVELICIVGLMILSYGGKAFGYDAYVVLSGSMKPEIHVGSLVYVDTGFSHDDIKTGDIIAFDAGSSKVTHRVVEKNENSYITKGDANENNDFSPVPYENVIGISRASLPFAGYILTFLSKPNVKIAILCAVAIQLLASHLLQNEKQKQ